MGRLANWVFGFGLLGWAIFTFITPYVIKVLFTPPVSFGINCEPAAAWSMSKLIGTQVVGVALFMILGVVASFYFRRKAADKSQVGSAGTVA